ncbi:hypothetical protein GGF31_006953 [Allomyces arbusculus]|nr:hypothetical protein GGF31_006953 [Allomyces arbusculus]
MTAPNPAPAVPLEYLGTICRTADGSYQVLNMAEAELAQFSLGNFLTTSSTASITAATSNTAMDNEDLIDSFANLNVSLTPSQHQEISLMHVTLNKKTMYEGN